MKKRLFMVVSVLLSFAAMKAQNSGLYTLMKQPAGYASSDGEKKEIHPAYEVLLPFNAYGYDMSMHGSDVYFTAKDANEFIGIFIVDTLSSDHSVEDQIIRLGNYNNDFRDISSSFADSLFLMLVKGMAQRNPVLEELYRQAISQTSDSIPYSSPDIGNAIYYKAPFCIFLYNINKHLFPQYKKIASLFHIQSESSRAESQNRPAHFNHIYIHNGCATDKYNLPNAPLFLQLPFGVQKTIQDEESVIWQYKFKNHHQKEYICLFKIDTLHIHDYLSASQIETIIPKNYLQKDCFSLISQSLADSIFICYSEKGLRNKDLSRLYNKAKRRVRRAHNNVEKNNAVMYKPPYIVLLYQIEEKYLQSFIDDTKFWQPISL